MQTCRLPDLTSFENALNSAIYTCHTALQNGYVAQFSYTLGLLSFLFVFLHSNQHVIIMIVMVMIWRYHIHKESDSLSTIPGQIGISKKLVYEERGKLEYLEKNLSKQGRTQPTYNVNAGI